MDLERSPPASPAEAAGGGGGGGGAACSICLDPVLARGGGRSVAKLQCGHEFHLDCIGSAFNAKGAMQCPNCRKIEKGRWLYARGHRPSADIDMGGWTTSENYDIATDLPFGFQWCPFSGFTQLASVFEEREAEPTSYHTIGDHPSAAASSSLVCPYLALRGFLHPVHVPSTSNSGAESTSFHRHSTGLEGHATPDLSNAQVFHATESRNHDRLPRYDTSSQQRSRSYAHHHPLIHRPTPRSGSNLVAPLGSVPAVVTETRGHGHGARGHMYQQSMHSSMQSSPFPPTTRRVRPRALTITSFIAAASSAEVPHGFSAPGAVNRSVPDAEGISRPIDRPYAWGREGFAPFPWIPAEGEAHWWGTFNPMQNHAHGSFTRRPAGERMPQNHPENGYQPVPPPQRMPPFL
ncbi:hypothetical protein SEVIR_6G235800v4 [Setaria viridis]|uniref:RING-type domain-containing protein n=2 Tax=Setaria viridis TaxID=4556 RepID=A0A4U6UCY5_SETVI|nr:E3 ubiquitin-protein ligase RFI2-like isoform X2 [Setaria viridis]TKW11479.1 hypothetical protein SEVIR_6G235800v2 [Setaria viridis]